MTKYDTAIIGAGPAGIMAAISAADAGGRVALIERNPQVGRKLLVTGSGRCNLTNRFAAVERYHGADPEFISTVLAQFDQHATMAFFEGLGLLLKEEDNGRIFPRTNQAASVVEILRHKLLTNGVDILLDAQVKAIEKREDWLVSIQDGRTLRASALVIATGGRAAHHLGSTGDGLYWAEKLGHTLTAIYPALVPLESAESWPKEIAGLKVEARVRATSDGEEIRGRTGDLLFTDYGVSGPAVMGLAGGIAPWLAESRVTLHIDLFPELAREDLFHVLVRIFSADEAKPLDLALAGILPGALIPIVLRISGLDAESPAGALTKSQVSGLVTTMQGLPLTVSKLRRLREAQVTSGGVDTAEVDPRTLQSRLVKGLYFAGEVLDVHGDSGGFNLQWAWSSGYVAGLTGE